MSVSSSFTLVICFGLSGWISNKSVRSLAFGKGFLKSEKWSDLPAKYVLMRWGVSGTGSPPPVVTALQLHLLKHQQLHLLTHTLGAFKKIMGKAGLAPNGSFPLRVLYFHLLALKTWWIGKMNPCCENISFTHHKTGEDIDDKNMWRKKIWWNF